MLPPQTNNPSYFNFFNSIRWGAYEHFKLHSIAGNSTHLAGDRSQPRLQR